VSRQGVAATMLREIRRGEAADELELIATDGTVLILHAHGLHPNEQLRAREAALKLLLVWGLQ
jgi:hypothetical protein